MPNHSEWTAWLRREAAGWVQDGLIDESQREKIVAKYPAGRAVPPPIPKGAAKAKNASAKSRLPAVLIGLAVLLIGIGLILFYAANWKRMPPPVKLAQVFAMILLSYGGAFFLLLGKKRWPVAGRGLLFLGMLSFGAGIALVVQMYHISAHPAKCVLLWAVFVALMAAVMRDRLGLYLAMGLVLIWDVWERTLYGSVNYPMILAIAGLFLLAVWVKCGVGRFICVLLAILWFYVVNFHYLLEDPAEELWTLFAWMQIPFGILLISAGVAFREKAGDALSTTVRLIGWIAVYVPLIVLSWPISFEVSMILRAEGVGPYLAEYAVCTGVAALLIALVARRGDETWRFLAIGLGVGVALLFVPASDEGIFMAILLLALLLFHFITLLAGARIGLPGASAMAIVLAATSLLGHSIGHLAFSFEEEELVVAAGLSGLLFIAVFFFMTLLIGDRKEIEGGTLATTVLSVPCICLAYVVLYIVSFFPGEQQGVFEAKPEWLDPAILLAALAVGLGTLVATSGKTNRKLMIAAAITTGVAIVLMVLPGALIPPTLRQLILNAMLFMIAGFLIAYAIDINSTALVNLGVVIVVLHVMTRYFDVFWNMLHGSVFFMVTGVTLFAVAGFMEWQRRHFLKRIRGATADGKEEEAAE